MPLLTIHTNQVLTDENRLALLNHVSSAVADLLGKPEDYVMVSVQDKQALIFAGSEAPCALLALKSLALAEEKTADYSAALCTIINQQLDIPADRIYIEFGNPARHMWGWNNRTF